jgi:hypothetical protein
MRITGLLDGKGKFDKKISEIVSSNFIEKVELILFFQPAIFWAHVLGDE